MKKQQLDLSNKCVECTTKEQFIEVLKWHEKKGHRLKYGYKPMDGIRAWDNGCNCLDIFDGFQICDKEYQEENGLTVLSFEEFKRDYCEPVYVHKYRETKDEKYQIIGECDSKNHTTGEWYDAIMYKGLYDEEIIFVREKNDFYEEFEVLVEGKDGANG